MFKGKLRPECTLNHLANNFQYFELRDLEEIILNAAHEKFRNLVGLLIKSEPYMYIK